MTHLYSNNAAGTLAAGITSTATSLTLNAGQAAAFPSPTSPDDFYATITDAATQSLIEIVLVTQVAGNSFTITRAQDGTTARSWNAGDIVSQRVVAAELRQWQGVVPIGGIIMWSGSVASIPENWALCNGASSTPNLENQFVVGAGGTYAPGATGGATSVTLSIAQLPAHNHGVSDPGHQHTLVDPGHNHSDAGHVHNGPSGTTFMVSGTVPLTGGGTGLYNFANNTATGNANIQASTSGLSMQVATTGITTQNTGSGSSVPTLPPYYALCYIMRVS